MRLFLCLTIALAGCKARTGRPYFVPFPEAEHAEIGFGLADRTASVIRVTQTVVAALRADSIPIQRVREFDGYFETGWFDSATLKPTERRPLGEDVVRIRGWIDPGKPGFSKFEIETVYIPVADPSLPDRELESPVPLTHPVARRIGEIRKKLVALHGPPEEAPPPGAPAARPAPARDTARADPRRVRDTTSAARPGAPRPGRFGPGGTP